MSTSAPAATSFPQSTKQIFVTPAVRLNVFPSTAVSPWASFGGGFGHFSENKNLNYYGTNPGGSTTSGVIQGGFGLDVSPFIKRFSAWAFVGKSAISGPALLICRWPIPAKLASIIILWVVAVIWHF